MTSTFPIRWDPQDMRRLLKTKLKKKKEPNINNHSTAPCVHTVVTRKQRVGLASLSPRFSFLHASAVLSSRCGRMFKPAAQLQSRDNLYQHGGRLSVCQPRVSPFPWQHQLREDIAFVSGCTKKTKKRMNAFQTDHVVVCFQLRGAVRDLGCSQFQFYLQVMLFR